MLYFTPHNIVVTLPRPPAPYTPSLSPGSVGGIAPRNGDWTGLEGPELGEYASSTSSRLLALFTPRVGLGVVAKRGGPHRFLLASGCISARCGLPNTSIGRLRVTHAMLGKYRSHPAVRRSPSAFSKGTSQRKR